MKTTRPVFLNLWQIRFPITALISIAHRISGIIIFLSLPLLLFLWYQSLLSLEQFADVARWLSNPFLKLLMWSILTAVLFHLFAGIRHLIMDFGWGEELTTARASAYGVFILTALCAILLGIWLC